MVYSYDNADLAEFERERAALIIQHHELCEQRKALEEDLRNLDEHIEHVRM
jgi:hypothetical protein